jgi:hypothetical protein
MLFSCFFSSSRVVDSTNDDAVIMTEESAARLPKRTLVQRCVSLSKDNKHLREANRDLRQMSALSSDNADRLARGNAELKREKDALVREMAYLEGCTRSHRIAVRQQAKDIARLQAEIKEALEHSSTEVTGRDAQVVQSLKTMINQMRERLTDPVSLELFEDPVTLFSGHTLSSKTVLGIQNKTPRDGDFRCPMTRESMPMSQFKYVAGKRSVNIAQLTDLYVQMQRALDACSVDGDDADLGVNNDIPGAVVSPNEPNQ